MDAGETELGEAALTRLHARLERRLYNVAYRFLWTAEDSQEVVQEAFLRLWRMRRRVRPDSVEPLLYRIAINLAIGRWRRRRLWRRVSLAALRDRASPTPCPEQLAATAEARDRMRRAVEELPTDLRSVVLLCEVAGLSYEQVAQALEIPAGTVASRRHRAMKQLRRALGGGPDAG